MTTSPARKLTREDFYQSDLAFAEKQRATAYGHALRYLRTFKKADAITALKNLRHEAAKDAVRFARIDSVKRARMKGLAA